MEILLGILVIVTCMVAYAIVVAYLMAFVDEYIYKIDGSFGLIVTVFCMLLPLAVISSIMKAFGYE